MKDAKYHPKIIASYIINHLRGMEADTPTGISKKKEYDRRTIDKYIDMLEELGVINIKKIDCNDGRIIKICFLSKGFLSVMEKKEERTDAD